MIQSGSESAWECPSCVGICTCAACRRRKDVGVSASAGKGKNGGGAKKKAAVAEHPADQEDQTAATAATGSAPDSTEQSQTNESNGAAVADALSVPPAHNAPPSPLSLSPPKKGVHMEYVEGEENPAFIHIARDSIVLPPSYSPRLTPKADSETPSQPMEVDAGKVE